MLKSLQQLVASAVVVRGETVIGHVEKIEIDSAGVYILLEDVPVTEGGGSHLKDDNDFTFNTAEVVRMGK